MSEALPPVVFALASILGHFKQAPPAVECARDEDCDVMPDGYCSRCDVFHGDPCEDCGARAYHRPGCPQLAEDPPEPTEPEVSSCRYCGAEYEGEGNDCGACGLNDHQTADYIREYIARGKEVPS